MKKKFLLKIFTGVLLVLVFSFESSWNYITGKTIENSNKRLCFSCKRETHLVDDSQKELIQFTQHLTQGYFKSVVINTPLLLFDFYSDFFDDFPPRTVFFLDGKESDKIVYKRKSGEYALFSLLEDVPVFPEK